MLDLSPASACGKSEMLEALVHLWMRVKKYINIPSEKNIYVHKYVYICVYTYLCKMDEYRYYAGLS